MEERGAEEVSAPRSHLAVGRHVHPAHGPASLPVPGARHQLPEAGEAVGIGIESYSSPYRQPSLQCCHMQGSTRGGNREPEIE